MLTWFPFAVDEMIRCCIIKMLAKFPGSKLYDNGFDFFASVFICVIGVTNSMATFNISFLKWNNHFFVAFSYL